MGVGARAVAIAAAVVAALSVGETLAAADGPPLLAVPDGAPLFATLSGTKEVGGGDADGLGGFAALRAGERLCTALALRNVAPPVAVGVFRGRAGAVGALDLRLPRPASGDPGSSARCQRVPRARLARIFARPGEHYVDVAARPLRRGGHGGAVRGQLGPRRVGGRATGALVASLGRDDHTAAGAFTAVRDGTRLCFGLVVRGLDVPRSVGIHRARAGSDGPLAIALEPPASGRAGASSGCASGTGPMLQELLTRPGDFYVSVDTAEAPDGAIRGRLGLAR